MAKITFTSITGSFASVAQLNASFQQIADELNGKVLYRVNPVGEPNSFSNNIDMNSNDILNVGSIQTTNLTLNGLTVIPTALATIPIPDQTGNSGKHLTTDGSALSWEASAIYFDTVALMVASTSLAVGDTIKTLGYFSKGDGGDNIYEVVAAATGTDDGGSFINLTTHQAKGLFPGGTVSVDQFGATGDWTGSSGTDDSAEFQNAIDFLGVTAGVVTLGFTKKYSITSEIFVKAGVVLRGPYEQADPRAGVDLEKLGGAIYLDSTATIKMDEASSIRGVIIIRANTTFPATAANLSEWAGTAITITFDSGGTFAADGVYIGHNTIVGFNRAVDAVLGTNTENVRVSYNNIDCINGVFIGQAFDVCYCDHNHLWPTASHQNGSSPTDADLRRSGTGFHFKDVGDWHKITDNFTFGYTIGYKVENCNSIQLVNSSADYTATNIAGVIGFQILGTSEETNLIACQAAGQKRGASVEISSTTNSVHFLGCTFWDNDDHHIIFSGGTGSVIGGKLRDGFKGITLAGGKRVLVSNVTFEDVATNFLVIDTGSTGDDFIIGQNKFIGTVGVASGLTTLSVASADPLPMPDDHDVITVTGTTDFGSISVKQWPGRRITLIFTGVLTVFDGSTKMAGNFVTSADDIITYVSDGTTFFEVSRSAN